MEPKKLYRSKSSLYDLWSVRRDCRIFQYRSTLIRLGFVLAACASFGTMILGYFVAAVIIPDEK